MDKRLIEGIESCRPGSDDLHADEMADVRQRVERDPAAAEAYLRAQRWDAAVTSVLEEVHVPEGLASRLLAGLQAENNVAAREHQMTACTAVPSVRGRPWRRRWVAWSSAVAIAAGAVAVFVASDLWRPASSVPWEEMADGWLAMLDPSPTSWRDVDQSPREFRVPAEIVATAAGWQPIGKSKHAVAFKLVRADGASAMLYIVRGSDSSLPAAAPADAQSTTGGKAVGYWQRGGFTFILVVPGDQRSYRQFVRATATPLA
jgi:hypothetical protein